MKINIAYIIPSLDIGGSEQKVIDLASGLNRDKFNPIIITITKKGKLASVLEANGIFVYCVNKRSKFDFFVVMRIAKILKQNNVDIVHVYTSTGKLWGRLAAKTAKTKVIISSEESLFRNKFLDRFLERRLINKTDLIITNSEGTLFSAAKATKIDLSKYRCIHNGINLEPYINSKSFGIIPKQKDEQIIMCVARLDPRKRIDLLIKAFSILKQEAKLKLVIVGSGSEDVKLKKYAKDLHLENEVIFLGSRSDVPSLLKEADVFVLPSDEEGFGNVIIEAMAAKVCVVASFVGGIPEIICHETNGLMFAKGDLNQLIEELRKVLNDKELRLKLVTNAFTNVSYFSKERMVNEHEEVYIEVIEGKEKL